MSFLDAGLPWNVREADRIDEVEPYQNYWIAAEGSKTEKWYFSQFAEMYRDLKVLPNIRVKFLDRNAAHETHSSPGYAVEKANLFKKRLMDTGKFEEGDQILLVFDLDIFKKKADVLNNLFEKSRKEGLLLGVTNPSFELFLLLHKEDAVNG